MDAIGTLDSRRRSDASSEHRRKRHLPWADILNLFKVPGGIALGRLRKSLSARFESEGSIPPGAETGAYSERTRSGPESEPPHVGCYKGEFGKSGQGPGVNAMVAAALATYLLKNVKTVVLLKVCPGRRIADGNCGLFGESGKCWVSRHRPAWFR
jgi:hypothetical protein